jgi:hypothetical protein
MALHPDTAVPEQETSSRLDRSPRRTNELARFEQAFSTQTIHHCERALDGSTFFRALAAGAVNGPLMKHIFLQYRLFRDQLHRWFAVCIVKAPSCRDPNQKAAIMALADHIFTDLRDSHEVMYDAFLTQLKVTAAEASLERPGNATRRYIRSFFDDFGFEARDGFLALAALGGRELCVSLRNQRLIRHYFEPRGIEAPTWIALHAHLELDHFHDAIRPVLLAQGDDVVTSTATKSAVERAIDQHVQLFDDLLAEHECGKKPRGSQNSRGSR